MCILLIFKYYCLKLGSTLIKHSFEWTKYQFDQYTLLVHHIIKHRPRQFKNNRITSRYHIFNYYNTTTVFALSEIHLEAGESFLIYGRYVI